MRVCPSGPLHGPSVGHREALHSTTLRGFLPTSPSEGWAFPLTLDQFYMMIQNASQAQDLVCNHNFWMRFLEQRDLWNCLVQRDESPGLALTSPSVDTPVRKKDTFV